MFELQCLALRKDSKMYKERIEAILQQMGEVAVERDQVGAAQPSRPRWPLRDAAVKVVLQGTLTKAVHARLKT